MREQQSLSNRYESIPKRDFKAAIMRHLEGEYKMLGSRRVLMMLADDIEDMVAEYFPMRDRVGFGQVVWFTTSADCGKVRYGKRAEEYEVKRVILPLITEEDIEARMSHKRKGPNDNYKLNKERDLRTMERLVKSAKAQGGLLSGAELSVLMNRSLSTIGRYLKVYNLEKGEILPTKGYVLDQGSNPSHKAIIISLYEQGISPADIVLRTGHNQESVDRYIKVYDQVLNLVRKEQGVVSICEVTGRTLRTIVQYLKLAKNFHPDLKVEIPAKGDKYKSSNE